MTSTPPPPAGPADDPAGYSPLFVARQPVFDLERRVRAYELLFRDTPQADTALIDDSTSATMKVVADAFACLSTSTRKDTRFMVNFTRASILDNVPYALSPERTMVEIGGPREVGDDLVAALTRLKKDGYQISLDDYDGAGDREVLLPLADVVKIDMLGRDRLELVDIVASVAPNRPLLAAKRVESADSLELAASLGITWFQGFFFQRPQLVQGRKLPSNQATRLRLFRMIEAEDIDFSRLAEVIQTDVSISYRLMTLLNSAAFGLPRPVSSIERAIMMIGWKQLKNWLRVVIFTDMAPTGKTRELAFASVLRGKFLEISADTHGALAIGPHTLFLLGLFSLLEPMLDIPMSDIVEQLPLDQDVKDALCGRVNAYSTWLSLAVCFESADWPGLDALIQTLDLDAAVIAKSYFEALDWTNSFFMHNV